MGRAASRGLTLFWGRSRIQATTGACLLAAWLAGCSSKGGAPPAPVKKGGRARRQPYVDLHLEVGEKPRIRTEGQTLTIEQLDAHLKTRMQGAPKAEPKWILYIPDKISIELAQRLFGVFADNSCRKVAVYAADARGDWPERDIGVEVSPGDPVRVITQFRKQYPKELRQFTGKHWPRHLLVAKLPLGKLDTVLAKLLPLSKERHVRVQEAGGLSGMPARRYIEVLAKLRSLGVRVVSFYGVYLE